VPAQNPLILVVEDDDTVRLLVQALLESQGYRVETAATGAAGLEAALSPGTDVALVVADIALPDWTGIDMAKELKKLRPSMPVLFTSGYVEVAQLSEITRDPTVRLLGKPVAPRELFAVVKEMLAARPH
jgi:two-component system cell cycle sensor histidine kinase/response regulator CckA